MNISRTKFVILFLISAFAFLFISNALYGSSVRLFPQHGEPWFGTESQAEWKIVVSTILLPIKIVLIGPMLPFINFLRQEPDTPPPFFVIGFAFYWTILALIIHYILGKIKQRGLFVCPECGFKYKEKEWADKCEAWCKEHHSCNLEITSHAEK